MTSEVYTLHLTQPRYEISSTRKFKNLFPHVIVKECWKWRCVGGKVYWPDSSAPLWGCWPPLWGWWWWRPSSARMRRTSSCEVWFSDSSDSYMRYIKIITDQLWQKQFCRVSHSNYVWQVISRWVCDNSFTAFVACWIRAMKNRFI